jgi:Putative peptidoglycan binding domain
MGFAASDIADWFEAKRKTRVHDLEEWVTDNPQWWNVALATVGATSMEFLGTYVDLLRLGEGAAEGGLAGFGTDGLRLISIVPVGRLFRMGGLAARARALPASLRIASKVKGVTGPCTFQAVNNAMQIARGKSLFVTVRQIAKAVGKPLRSVGTNPEGKFILSAWVDDLVNIMRANGGRVKLVTGLNSIEEVVRVARTEGAPVVFAFRTTVKDGLGKLKEIRHSVIAIRDASGAVKFADYGGKMFGSLDQLVSRWGSKAAPIELYKMTQGASAAVVGGTVEALGEFGRHLQQGAALVLSGMDAFETDEDGVDVAFPVTVAAVNAPAQADDATAQVVKESFENFVQRKTGGPLAATRPRQAPMAMEPIEIKGRVPSAPRADWLTGVQFRLNHLGFAAGPVDGVAGPLTQRAVRAFQKYYPPLIVDGVPGPLTQARLVQVCGY